MTPRLVRPLLRWGEPLHERAFRLAGGWTWFDTVAVRSRGAQWDVLDATALGDDERARLTAPRARHAGMSGLRPSLMGILNTTPDSFSDGGLYFDADAALAHARALHAAGANIIDIGGESTRPGAAPVPEEEETRRTIPVISALVSAGLGPVSIDTRKAPVALAGLQAGAVMVNDVSALGHDPNMAEMLAGYDAALCLMHAQGGPENMQDDPRYDDVVADVYDVLAARVAAAEEAGIARERLIVDPGIGFGKTVAHNLALIRDIAVFHGLGCKVLLGASRKRFIGVIGGGDTPADRVPGSVAAALWAVSQGVQVLRVHDVAETRQALDLYRAIAGDAPGQV